MKQLWIFWTIAAVLIVMSIVYELVTGTAHARIMGEYRRDERPGAFWTVVILKGLLASLIAAIGYSLR